jgi:hypothetical protein
MKHKSDPETPTSNEPMVMGEDKIASIMQPDTLLSEQYFDTFRRTAYLEPEKHLMLAVLEDAIRCYQDNYVSRSRKRKRFFHEVKEWLASEDSNWVFSFEYICYVLDLDPAYIRQGLLLCRPSLGAVHGGASTRMG